MCGIAGFIDFKQTSSYSVLEQMTDSLYHRGPDGSGYQMMTHSSAQIGLGHRRLSIIDLTDTGKQPMQFNQFTIVFNGEVYNYKEIKAELIGLGHQFYGNSDTEVVIHAFSEWRMNCISKFIGMFAFVIFDASEEVLYCMRDRAGIKPFYFYFHEGLFLFASELKAFHQHPGFKKELDTNAVASFMQYGYVPTPYSIFKHCHKLKPGHYLHFSIRQSSFVIHKYWDVYDAYNKPKLDISFSEAKQETEKVLESAFNYRMIADVPVGLFLSGGYDSACLAALLQKNNSDKLKTFTIGVPDIGLNESEYAKNVAKYLGTEHHEYFCTQKEALELIDDLPYYYDEPFADSSAIPTTLVCKMARQHVTVALSADAGDEVFAGYNRYDYMMKHGKILKRIPKAIRKTTALAMHALPASKIPVLNKKYNFPNRYEKLKNLLKDPSSKNMMLSLSQQFDEKKIKDLFKYQIEFLQTAHFSEELKDLHYSPLSYMMAVDYQTYLLDDILQKVDRASMTVSLEAREPFLDYRVIEWAAQLPDEFKYHKGIKKYILKEIVHQYIPKEMMDRPKMGFAIPIEHWMLTDLKDKVNYYLSDKLVKEQGIFNHFEVDKYKRAFFSGKKEYGNKIWYLLMFQMWYEKWMK